MAKFLKSWRQKAALAEISGELVAGMDRGCAFAADRARAEVPVRTGLTREDIAYTVDVDGLEIVGKVGVRTGKAHAWYAAFIEFGTSKMAAQPFLRPAVLNNKRRIVKLIAGD